MGGQCELPWLAWLPWLPYMVSSYNNFWVTSLQRKCSKQVIPEVFQKRAELYTHNTPTSPEEFYYRQLFEKLFPGQIAMVPHISRPSFDVGTDPSPRTWPIYSQHLCLDFLSTVRMMI
eukprot:sb/3476432/